MIPKFIRDWIVKIVAGKIGKQLFGDGDSKGGSMESKKWWQSKTIIAAIVSVILSVYQVVLVVLAPTVGWNLPPIPDWVLNALTVVLGSVVVYGRTSANTTIK